MTLHKNIGENADIDAGNEIEDVSYEPQEAETEIIEEKSDAQQLKDGDVVLDIDKTEEVEVSPHSIYKPPEKEEGKDEEDEEVEEEEEKEEGEEEEEVKEEKEEDKEKQEDEEEPEKEEKKPAAAPDAVQKRINKITREKYDAQRETDKLKKELAEAKKQLEDAEFLKKKSDLVSEKPNSDDFEEEDKYHEALGRWAAKMEIANDAHDKLLAVEEVVEEEPENVVQKIIDVGKETYPDFEELVLREDLKITPLMVEAAADSEHATEIFYHLGQHPELAEKIASMRSPAQVAREIGRIEFDFIQDEVEEVVTQEPTQDTEEVVEGKKKIKKKKKTPVAPPPVKPLGGGGKTSKSLEDMSLADYYEARGYTRDGMKKSLVS